MKKPNRRLPVYEIERDKDGMPLRMVWCGWEPTIEEKLLAFEIGWRTERGARERLEKKVRDLEQIIALRTNIPLIPADNNRD